MIEFHFNVKKSAQAASILLRLNGGDMGNYCFIKMLYLADREAIKRWGLPITGDAAVSMQHGPVLSQIYDLTKGEAPHLRAEWEPFISDADEETHRVVLKAVPENDELSEVEIRILQKIHTEFKGFSWKQMRDYCHRFEEYDGSVGKSSKPIANEKILKAVGKSADEIAETERSINEAKMLQLLFGA